MIGQTISHYKIVEKLGEGGMGVVYKAEDTNLKRSVALKFPAPHLLQDEEARKRFEREATAAAGLSHPNICTVHEISDEGGQTFLAMEFIEGESLDAKIERGPLSLKDALGFARQVADGLAAAHAKGVVHRDIKPGNLLVTPEGRVKILDFGLALLTEGSKLTKLDTTVGTVAYMSPEQAQGMEVDCRTDLWALGCVLYEMVRGQRPFQGVYDQALVYEIVNQEPEPLTSVRTGVPMELEWIVGKCLAKDREDRYGRAEDMMLDLRTLADKLKSGGSTVLRTAVAVGDGGSRHVASVQGSAGVGAQRGLASQQTAAPVVASEVVLSKGKFRMLQALLTVAIIALMALAFVHFGQTPPEVPEAPLRRFALAVEGQQIQRVEVSPDVRHIAYIRGARVATRELWIWDLDRLTPRKIEIARGGPFRPFWSPNSDYVAFRTTAARELKKVSVHGGPASTICSTNVGFAGGTWSPDGNSIVFSSSSGDGGSARLYEVPAQGGTAKLLFEAEESEQQLPHSFPYFLPNQGGSRGLLFGSGLLGSSEIVVLDLESGRQDALAPGSRPVYSLTGHIVYRSENALWALPFSAETLRSTGEPFPVAGTGSSPSVSRDGTLVYHHVGEAGLE